MHRPFNSAGLQQALSSSVFLTRVSALQQSITDISMACLFVQVIRRKEVTKLETHRLDSTKGRDIVTPITAEQNKAKRGMK
jgi:hypothetical protein